MLFVPWRRKIPPFAPCGGASGGCGDVRRRGFARRGRSGAAAVCGGQPLRPFADMSGAFRRIAGRRSGTGNRSDRLWLRTEWSAGRAYAARRQEASVRTGDASSGLPYVNTEGRTHRVIRFRTAAGPACPRPSPDGRLPPEAGSAAVRGERRPPGYSVSGSPR